MRIQNNIMAMNAYRNYTNNTNALSANLEKLSSGYKINRAGDDAAGLAISEKMRAQITGLEGAQNNAKDGISLVQTAEGALTEVHDMLNRMYSLAEQSANGTYEDETDRAQLQKEVKNLKDEINRIADSTNFNGINLLDGSLSGSSVPYTNGTLNIAATGTTQGTHTIVHKDGHGATAPSFSVDLSELSFTATDNSASFTITIGGTAFTVDDKTELGGGGAAINKGDSLTGTQIADLLAAAINKNDSTLDDDDSNAIGGVLIDGVAYTATASNGKLTFTVSTKQNDGTSDITGTQEWTDATIPQNAVTINTTATNGTVSGADKINAGNLIITPGIEEAEDTAASTVLTLTADMIKDGNKITIGDQTFVFKIGKDSEITAGDGETLVDLSDIAADDADLVDIAIGRLSVAGQSNSMWSIGSNASGKITLTEKSSYTGDADLTTAEGIQATISMQIRGAATEDKSLTLQIGDTSDSFNQLKVSINDCHADQMGVGEGSTDTIADIDIGTQAGAKAALKTIENAINYVSDVRGTLGATQNRLDHTINNLSVMQENIQDAESTIRDTDVAEEMMAYTKNNILIQSAQAMLAQANQVPQGVLQLLQ